MRCNLGAERGNIFVIVFLGVVLFAALIYAVSRGFSTGTSTLTTAQARNYASDILSYAQQVERGVTRILESGISENDISFQNDVVSGYAHIPVVPTDAQIFNHPKALGAPWVTPIGASTYQGNNEWTYDGKWIVTDLGDNSRSELAMYLFVNYDVCNAINAQIGKTIDLTLSIGGVLLVKFRGTYDDDVSKTLDASVTGNGCYHVAGLGADGQSGNYFYIHVLLPR
jgi:hypothetical protein